MPNSLQIQKDGTIFQIAVVIAFFDEYFSFVIWHKLGKFQLQIVFTSQVIP